MNPHNLHTVITGRAAGALAPVARRLRDLGADVTVGDRFATTPASPVTCVIVAERFNAGADWNTWAEHDERTAKAMRNMLPHLARSSHGLLVGFAEGRNRPERAEIRGGMALLISRFHSYAASKGGVDHTMNGLEVPVDYDETLLVERITAHALRPRSLADEVVIRLDDLEDTSIAQALTADIV